MSGYCIEVSGVRVHERTRGGGERTGERQAATEKREQVREEKRRDTDLILCINDRVHNIVPSFPSRTSHECKNRVSERHEVSIFVETPIMPHLCKELCLFHT